MENKKQPHFPCRNCIYFNTCGESNRTEPCYGRVTKSDKKAENKEKQEGKIIMLQVSIISGIFSILLKGIAKIDKTDVKGTLFCSKLAEVSFLVTGCISLL